MRTGANWVLRRSTAPTAPLYVVLLSQETKISKMGASSVGAVVFPSKAKKCSMTWNGRHSMLAENLIGECEDEKTNGADKCDGVI